MLYDQMHLFLDESGKFESANNQRIIGGVLLFGPYTQANDDTIYELLETSIENEGGSCPQDLHFGTTGWDQNRKTRFFNCLFAKFNEEDLFNRTYGVSIVHSKDISNADQDHDNRYRNMLLFLIEHLLFVSKKVKEKLQRNANIYIIIASRQFVFKMDSYTYEKLRQLGWGNHFPDSRDPNKRFVLSVNDSIIRSLINPYIDRNTRWETDLVIGIIELPKLDYDNRIAKAAHYLADLQLGAIRGNIELLEPICRITYCPKMHFLHNMEAYLSKGNFEEYLKNNYLFNFNSDFTQLQETHQLEQDIQRRAVELAENNSDLLSKYLLEASKLVDMPTKAKEGFEKAVILESFLSPDVVTNNHFFVLQTKLSFYNHTGDLTQANIIWNEFLKVEKSPATLNLDGLNFKIEIRNRRAVSLMDHFSYDAAKEVINEVVSIAGNLRLMLATSLEGQLTDIRRDDLGACYGTLGQLYAFQGDKDYAHLNFQEAQSLFSDSKDIKRQWVYLGHLACDMGELIGKTLWKEVTDNLDGIDDLQLVVGDGCQFLLALQLKGKLVFGTNGQIIQLADILANNQPLDNFSANVKNAHPYGLILQMAGLICARAWKETKVEKYYIRAIDFFRSATKYLTKGGSLLKLLANVCTLRKLLLEFQKTGVNNNNQINSVINEFITHAKDIGEHAWSEDASGRTNGYFGAQVSSQNQSTIERAQKIVDLIRFNYW